MRLVKFHPKFPKTTALSVKRSSYPIPKYLEITLDWNKMLTTYDRSVCKAVGVGGILQGENGDGRFEVRAEPTLMNFLGGNYFCAAPQEVSISSLSWFQ